jgi:hypothetical protein
MAKNGTIHPRSDWYRLKNPPIGDKLGGDVDNIDLDVTLEKYAIAKQFLMPILRKFSEECNIDLSKLLNDGAQNRLVLASGGVARDCLAIFRRSIQINREGGVDRINTEHASEASGEDETSKREDFRRDTADDEEEPSEAFRNVVNFCFRDNNTNCLLIDKSSRCKDADLIHQLVDLKPQQLARSRVTVRTRPGDIFEAYMLDFSQYPGSRRRHGLKVIEFWRSGNFRGPRRIYGSYP